MTKVSPFFRLLSL